MGGTGRQASTFFVAAGYHPAMDFDGTKWIILRVALLIASWTLLLTASFVGLIAAISGEIQGFESRLHWYFGVTAVVFVATILLLELNDVDGKTIIIPAVMTGLLSFTLFFLAAEGVLFTMKNPEIVAVSRLVIFLSAALVATGLTYWALRHWREFKADTSESR